MRKRYERKYDFYNHTLSCEWPEKISSVYSLRELSSDMVIRLALFGLGMRLNDVIAGNVRDKDDEYLKNKMDETFELLRDGAWAKPRKTED